MRSCWLLRRVDERGAAPVEMVFAIIFLMTLSLGVTQVAFSLYARNVVTSSAHEGARAALERGRGDEEAAAIVRAVVRKATGRLLKNFEVAVTTGRVASRRFVTVHVEGVVTDSGPVPIPFPLSSTATAQIDEAGRR